jgi:hypothetical protein
MRKIILAFSVAVMLAAVGSVSATLPEINDNRQMTSTVANSVPYFIYGWIDILDQLNVYKYTNFDVDDLIAAIAAVEATMSSHMGFTVDLDLGGVAQCIDDYYATITFDRCDPYTFESEQIWIYVIVADLSGSSDFWQHQLTAWWSPEDGFMTDMGMTEDFAQCSPHDFDGAFLNEDKTVAIAKGEQLVEPVDERQCDHDIYLKLFDKYGDTAFPPELEVIPHIYLNPYFGATFDPAVVTFLNVYPCAEGIAAVTNPHELHVGSFCVNPNDPDNPIPVCVKYDLSIHGTDLEGASESNLNSVIEIENVCYEWEHISGSPFGDGCLTCGEIWLGEFTACEIIKFWFFLDVPCGTEPGDYHGEVGFGIAAV